MKANQARYPLSTMARLLKVSRSGFHAWMERRPSAHAVCDMLLLAQLREIHARSRDTYGMPRVHATLLRRGIHVGRKRVARLMREAGLRGACRQRFICTTHRAPISRPAPDLVQRHFCADAPNQLWVADATYIPTAAGFYYLAVVLDVYSRRIVGWAMGSHLRTALMLQALDMALAQRHPSAVIHHSDQGCQYTSVAFGRRCRDAGVQPSMGSVGDAYDNAMCESFFATLECELLMRLGFATHDDARQALFTWIEGWYNPHRLHSALGYRSPQEFEKLTVGVMNPALHRAYTAPSQGENPLT